MKTERSLFNLSNEVKTTFEMGQLVPHLFRDALPSDEWQGQTNTLVRLAPMLRPVMHKVELFQYHYYVPYRLLSNDFRNMVTRPLDGSKFTTLYDYLQARNELHRLNGNILMQDNLLRAFGISSSNGELTVEAAKSISMMPFYAYYLIYNHFYLDPIINKDFKEDFSPDDFTNVDVLKIQTVNKYGDYFTHAKPDTQYGNELVLDLDGDGTIKVSEMRLAERLQIWFEKLFNNYEHKYHKTLRGMYGVSPDDKTLQRPLFLGGDKKQLQITDVDQTASYGDEALGSSAGKSVTTNFSNRWNLKALEHGIILGLSYILPRQNYIAGIPREFQKVMPEDIHNPLMNNLGMQELKGNELSAERTDTFGYVERYHEYKHSKDIIAGDFVKPTNNMWHFGIDIRNSKLNESFLKHTNNYNPFFVKSHLSGGDTRRTNSVRMLYAMVDVTGGTSDEEMFRIVDDPESYDDRDWRPYDNGVTFYLDFFPAYVEGEQGGRLVGYAELHSLLEAGRTVIVGRLRLNSNGYLSVPHTVVSEDDAFWDESMVPMTWDGVPYVYSGSYDNEGQDHIKVYIKSDPAKATVQSNHVAAVFYNDCKAVRPLPKRVDTLKL